MKAIREQLESGKAYAIDEALDILKGSSKLKFTESVDVAIRLGRLEDSSLVAKKLSQRQLYVCASPEYIDLIVCIMEWAMMKEILMALSFMMSKLVLLQCVNISMYI